MRGIFIWFVIFFVLLLPSVCAAETYYVDATGGDDSNDGTSPETAWKTISKVNSMSFSPGDNILFKRGEVWREQLTVPSSGSSGNPITFSSYGTGNKPKLLHSVAKNSTDDWTDEGENLWYAGSFGISQIRNVIMDSENSVATMVTNKADLNVQGEAWWDSANGRIYMYSTSNPATYYNGSLECARNLMNKIQGKSYIVIDGIDHRYTGNDFWYIYDTSNYVTIQNCVFRFAGSDLSGLGQAYGPAVISRCAHSTISNNDFYYAFIAINIIPTATGCVFTIENNTIQKMVGKEADADGINVGGTGDARDCSGSIIRGNDVSEFADDGIDLYFGYNITVESNVVHDSARNGDGNGIKCGGSNSNSGNQILRNYVYNINTGAKNGIVTNGASDGVIAYNIIKDVGNRGIWVYGLGASGENDNWEVYNNVCYNCLGHAIVVNSGIDADNKITTTIQNNIVDSNSESDIAIGSYATITGGYNCLINDATASVGGSSTYSGSDLGSTDPLFVDASNNDFHLQSGSPCIDAGTDVNLTQDYDGNAVPQGSAPDIGAYEYAGGAVCEPNTYYVDATYGNDNNDGRCTNTAWKTISKVNGMSFNPGDNVLFKRGEEWREQLNVPSSGSAGNPITFGAYGSGDYPIISGADLFASWTGESGNLWYVSVSWFNPDQVFFDDTRGDMKSAKGDLADEYDWWYDSVNDRLYVYSASDPDTVYTSPGVEAGWRPRGIYVNNKNYITIDGVQAEKNRGAGGAAIDVIDSDYVTVKNCIVDEFVVRGIHFYSSDNGVITDNTASTTYDRSTHNHRPVEIGTWEDSNSSCQNITISGNSLSGNPVASKSDGIVIRYSSSVTIDSNTIHDVREYGIDILASSSDVTVSNNTVYDIGYEGTTIGVIGIEMHGSSSNVTVYGNTVYNIFRGSSGIDGVGIFVDQTATDCDVYNNLVHTTDGTGIRVFKTNNADIHHNIVYDCGNNPGKDSQRSAMCVNQGHTINFYNNILSPEEKYGIYLYGTAGINTHDINVKNNIVYEPTAYAIYVDQYSTTNIAGDYNDFYFTSGKCGHWAGTDYNTLANWQSGTSQDSNSIDFDPLFINAPNGDFHLQPNSPCIDAGVDMGFTQDFEGNPVPRGSAPDIGAYEYASGIPGDINNDGDVDIVDLGLVALDFGKTSGFDPTADVVQNSEIDVFDVVFVASRFT
jgi:parallel beta-helix repeat protein